MAFNVFTSWKVTAPSLQERAGGESCPTYHFARTVPKQENTDCLMITEISASPFLFAFAHKCAEMHTIHASSDMYVYKKSR